MSNDGAVKKVTILFFEKKERNHEGKRSICGHINRDVTNISAISIYC